MGEKRLGEVMLFSGLVDWGIQLLDSIGRWELLMELSHLRALFGPGVAPLLVFVGMLLYARSREHEHRRVLDEAMRPSSIIGVEPAQSKASPFWKPLFMVMGAAAMASIVCIVGLLLFYSPKAPVVSIAPPPVDPLAYRVWPSPTPNSSTPPTSVRIIQTTNAPCSGNAVQGNVDNNGCGTPDPYKPVITYQPGGAKTSTSPNLTFVDTDLIPIGKQITSLINSHDWSELLRLSEKTRGTDPGWFTLDYASGVAEFGLCDKTTAEKYLQKLVSETNGVLFYHREHDQAQAFLAQMNDFNYESSCLIAMRQK